MAANFISVEANNSEIVIAVVRSRCGRRFHERGPAGAPEARHEGSPGRKPGVRTSLSPEPRQGRKKMCRPCRGLTIRHTQLRAHARYLFSVVAYPCILAISSPRKAVEGHRTPRRWRVCTRARAARSVLDCACPLALGPNAWPLPELINNADRVALPLSLNTYHARGCFLTGPSGLRFLKMGKNVSQTQRTSKVSSHNQPTP